MDSAEINIFQALTFLKFLNRLRHFLLTFHLILLILAHFSNDFRVDLLLQITNINRRLGSILDSPFEFFITNRIEIGDVLIFGVLDQKQSDDFLMVDDLISCAVFINLETLEMAVD